MPRNDSGIERQILWYKYSQSANQFRDESLGEKHFYNFLIINTPDQFPLLKQKIRDALQPILLEKDLGEGDIANSGLNFVLLSVATYYNKHLNPSRIYQGKFKWDRRLQPRRTEDGWNDLIEKLKAGEFS
jgi:hypothetical protein